MAARGDRRRRRLERFRIESRNDAVEVVVEREDVVDVVALEERNGRRIRETQPLVVVPLENIDTGFERLATHEQQVDGVGEGTAP